MNGQTAEELLRETGAILEGHFLLTSGLHSRLYVEKFNVLQHPEYTEKLCEMIANHFKDEGVETVIGPATGGIILSQVTARILGTRSIFTERENGKMTLRRGFRITPGEKVLIVEDIVTTGGSIREVVDVVKSAGGDIRGIGLFVDRSGGHADYGVPEDIVFPLVRLTVPTYSPDDCPLCKEGVPITERGSHHLKK